MARKRDNKNENKNKRNNPTTAKTNAEDANNSDNDSIFNDNASSYSQHSNADENADFEQETGDSEPIEEVVPEDVFITRINEIIEELLSKPTSRTRSVQLYESLAKAFKTRFCDETFFENRSTTIKTIIDNGLKSSANDAFGSAALALSMVLITMGDCSDSNELFQSNFQQMERALINPSAKPEVRARCAIALSIGCFITDFGLENIDQLMENLLRIAFSTVRGQTDDQLMKEINNLKATCLDMINFLITACDDPVKIVEKDINKYIKCLESTDLNIRVASGECFALLYEHCIEMDDDERPDLKKLFNWKELRDKLNVLSKDSQKSKSKKELRTQRVNFRQILSTMLNDPFAEETIKFGTEQLTIDSWKMKIYYDSFCKVLGSGMNLHLKQNPLLREIFDLGPVVLDNTLSKLARSQTKSVQNAKRKTREQNRSKLRDKRGFNVDY